MVSEGFDRENYFERKGFVSIPNIIGGVKLDEEAATDLAIECSCEEVEVHDETLEVKKCLKYYYHQTNNGCYSLRLV